MRIPHLVAVLIVVLFGLYTQAQVTTKLDLRLWNKLQQGELNNIDVQLLVQGDSTEIKRLTEKLGGTFFYNYGDIASVSVPGNRLKLFSESDAVEKIENTQGEGRSLMDTARIQNNIDSVHAGVLPLPLNLKGRGVIVGIIDGGIYWQHMDFKNPTDSTTRIRYIWDQRHFGTSKPLPYNYGNQWNWLEIDNGTCAHVPPYLGDSSDGGHGTAVAGAAVGNSLSTKGTVYENQFTGVAPESEIIAVRVNYKTNFLTNVANAVDYIFKKADALGRPCVINTSIGTYYGSHDGKDLATRLIDRMLSEKSGRSLVAAAGNGGNIPFHLSYEVPFDSAYTFFKYNLSTGKVYFDLWADTLDFQNVSFKVGANDSFGNHLASIEYLNILTDFTFTGNTGNVIARNLYQSNTYLGSLEVKATIDEGRYHIEFEMIPSNSSHLWRLQTTGTGTFDLWSSAALMGTSSDMTSYVKTGNPLAPEALIQLANYRHPDTLKSLVSSWQNSERVVAVGNYFNRSGFLDKDSTYVNLMPSGSTDFPGKRVSASSIGPTRTGLLKPDITATGSSIVSTGDGNFIPRASANRVSVTGKHLRNGGTSMSSPIVAGTVALYLEQHPTANYQEIKQALICSAKTDSFTGNTPNTFYGYGKLNAFAMVTVPSSCFVYGARDTACINYNPLANVDTGSCVPKVYGCTDSVADNFDMAANVDNGTCTYSVGLKTVPSYTGLSVQPNPFESSVVFRFADGIPHNSKLFITGTAGQKIDEIRLIEGEHEYTYQDRNLSSGLYFYTLTGNGKHIFTGKLIAK